ncbi:MAG: hypothetical protein JXR59_10775 [Desulfuromonadaceae bacterium]|nr:hypothetical protein [Desulfuromonadaceae bacterium]
MSGKKIAVFFMGCLILMAGFGSAVAVDYQSMTLDELNALRGSSTLADSAEREAFQQARQEKIQALSPEDRQGLSSGNSSAKKSASGVRLQDGSCNRSMQQMRQGGGHGRH